MKKLLNNKQEQIFHMIFNRVSVLIVASLLKNYPCFSHIEQNQRLGK